MRLVPGPAWALPLALAPGWTTQAQWKAFAELTLIEKTMFTDVYGVEVRNQSKPSNAADVVT